jgi:hypothetical protein
VATDLFALGSTIYELLTSCRPYEEVPSHEVEGLYGEGEFPDVSNLLGSSSANVRSRYVNHDFQSSSHLLRYDQQRVIFTKHLYFANPMSLASHGH